MSPINFSLYEELPEPFFLQLQRREAEEKAAAEKKIILEHEDRDLFLKSLENPPEPNQKLKDAFEEYRNKANY